MILFYGVFLTGKNFPIDVEIFLFRLIFGCKDTNKAPNIRDTG